jgi:hypothetical protein
MVAVNVDELGRPRPVCYARPLLLRARCAADQYQAIEAACFLREALVRYLEAACVVAADNERPQGRRPGRLIEFLAHRNAIPDMHAQWLREAARACHRALRCRNVDPTTLRGAAEYLLLTCAMEHRIEFPWREGAGQ